MPGTRVWGGTPARYQATNLGTPTSAEGGHSLVGLDSVLSVDSVVTQESAPAGEANGNVCHGTPVAFPPGHDSIVAILKTVRTSAVGPMSLNHCDGRRSRE
jgi:hypothetical protein